MQQTAGLPGSAGRVWRVTRDTVLTAMRHRVSGLAAEGAFFTLVSLPPLFLGLIGTLGHLKSLIGAATIGRVRDAALEASHTALTDRSVDTVIRPMLDDVLRGGRFDIISAGFLISLWSGSRAVNVYVDTIAIVSGHGGTRGIIRTRLLSFSLYLAGLAAGLVVIPFLFAGPDLVAELLPVGRRPLSLLYWPVLTAVSVALLTALYHVSVPSRRRWHHDLPGAVVALAIWIAGSAALRVYLGHALTRTSVYGSLAAPIAVLAWLYLTALAVLLGAALNAALRPSGGQPSSMSA
jgi:membrane protein